MSMLQIATSLRRITSCDVILHSEAVGVEEIANYQQVLQYWQGGREEQGFP